jgi:hypothetical protein
MTLYSPRCPLNSRRHINDSVFVKQLEDGVLIMSKKELMTSYEHIQCGVNSNNNPVSFIGKWTSCNDNINRKDSMQIYPNRDKYPDNVFDLWRPFAMEVLTSPYEKHTKGLEIMLTILWFSMTMINPSMTISSGG